MALADINVRIGAEISQFQSGLRKAERELQRTADKFNELGNNLSLGVSLPLAAAGAAAFKFASGFETATVKIENLVGVQGAELDDLKAKFQQLGPVVGKTQQELADAALFITGAGLRGAEALDALESSAKGSAIGLGDQAAVAKVAGAAVAAYGAENISASGAVDKLLGIVKAGNAEAADLAPVLGRVLPIAAQLGVSFDEVGANIATFTRLGINAEGAVDGIKSALTNILKPSDAAKKALAGIGLTAQQVRDSIAKNGLAATLQSLTTSFGDNVEGLGAVFGDVQGLTAVLATAGAQGDVYAQTLRDIQSSAGGVNAAFEKTAETADFKLKKAFASLSLAGTEFGAAIVPVVVQLAEAVVPLAQGFASLSDGTKTLVVSLGLAAVAAGPLFRTIGGGIEVFKAGRSAILSFGKAAELAKLSYETLSPAIGGTGAALRSATVAWRALDVVAKATVIGAAVAVVVALGAALYKLSENAGAAAQSQQRIADAVASANVEVGKERILSDRLFGTLLDLSKSTDQRAAALKTLQEKYPAYLEGMSVEKTSLDQIRVAQGRVNEELVKTAALRAKTLAQESAAGEIAKKLQRITQLREGAQATPGEATKVNTGELIKYGSIANGVIVELQKEVGILTAEMGKLDDEFEKTFNIRRSGESVVDTEQLDRFYNPEKYKAKPLVLGGAPLPEKEKGRKEKKKPEPIPFNQEGSFRFGDTKGFDYITDAANESSLGMEKLAASFGVATQSQNSWATVAAYSALTASDFEEAWAAANVQTEAAARFTADLAAAAQSVIESGIEGSLIGIGEAIGGIFSGTANAGSLLASVLDPILSMVEQLGKIAIGTGLAIEGIKKALESLNPVAAIAAGVGLIALSKIVRGQLKSLQPKAFADGGLVYGPTYSLTGEYPGAKNNPEVIAPLSKLRDIIGDTGGRVEVVGRLYGGDIMLANERSFDRRTKRRGY